MKKFIALALAMIMVFSLAACGEKKEEEQNTNPLGLVEPGKLTVAISPDFAPMEFVDTSKSGQEQFVGFDVTLAQWIAEDLGLELQIKPMDFSACQAAVQSKNVDMSISGFSPTEERKENFQLSQEYDTGNEGGQGLLVAAANGGNFKEADDFSGLTIGCQAASLQLNLVTEQLYEVASDVKIKQFTDLGTAVIALTEGTIDALAVAKGNGEAIITNNDKVAFTDFWFEIDDTGNVILMHKDSAALCEAVNAAMTKAQDAKYYAEWYAAARELAGIETAAEISYDEEGNEIKDESK
ncbi:MAG: transporter substrate-binding domain-containing protein [Firmicutes bacterium]|nr:transporter substrate-binding domain-containing protein [Bacillota bacterium]